MNLKRESVFITIFLGTLFQFIFLFSHNILFLIQNTLPDDAFYYFQIARNIAHGCGSTMDCINITNGYHPLWMLALIPIFKVFSVGGTNDTFPIYVALTLSILFSTIAAIYLKKILQKLGFDTKIILLVLIAYFLSPQILYNVLNGLETSLVLILLSIYIFLSLKLEENFNKNNILNLAVAGGLLILARLDMIVLVFATNLYILYKFKDEIIRFQFSKKFWHFIFISISGTTIIFLPWFVFNYEKFGTFLTSASVTSTFINHELTYSDNGGKTMFLYLKTIIYMLDRALDQFFTNAGGVIFPISVFSIFMYFFFKNFSSFKSKFKEGNISILNFNFIGLLILMFVSAGLRWTFRSWYFIPHLFFFYIILSFVISYLKNEFNDKYFKYFYMTVLAFLLAIYIISFKKDLLNREILQKTIYEATIWQNENLPEGSHLGVFNAGIQTYFSKHRVTNLDGLVNQNASDAMIDRRLWKYITEEVRPDYISDFDSYITYRYKNFFGENDILSKLEKIHTINGEKDLNIYKTNF